MIQNHEYNLENLCHTPGKNILYICGCSGSGKTTLATEMAELYYPVLVISLDAFMNNPKAIFDRKRILDSEEKILTLGEQFIKTYLENRYNGEIYFKEGGCGFGKIMKGYKNHIRLFLEYIRKEARKSEMIFIVEGIQLASILEKFPNTFSGKESLIIMGTGIQESARRATVRDEIDGYYGMQKDEYFDDRVNLNQSMMKKIERLEKIFQ